MRNTHVKLYGIWTSGSGDVVYDISYRKLWQPLCSADRNHLCKVEGIMRINYVKLFLEFGPVVQEEMLFKRFLYLELWQPICSVERDHLMLKEGIMGSIQVELYEIWTSG